WHKTHRPLALVAGIFRESRQSSPMNTDLQAITAQLATVAASLSTLQEALASLQEQQAAAANNNPLAPFSAFLMVELTPYFGGAMAKHIVDSLNRCNQRGDYRYFIPMYEIAGEDLDKRQLLKLVSAVHRYKFVYSKQHNHPQKYSLQSTIKYAKACSHCGKLAATLYDRLVKEGLF
ncbi:MAG: hypothetical protein ACO4CS_19915, partial [bacterium]